MDISGMKINFLGDSITVGHGASEHRFSYVGRFVEKYPQATIRSYCIGGSCISNKCVWGVESMCDRIDKMNPDADLIVAFGGTNDFGCGVPLGTPDDRTDDTFHGACYSMLYKLHERFGGKPIVVATPLHRRGENLPGQNGRVYVAPLSAYVDALRQAAVAFGCPIIDLNGIDDFRTEPMGRGEALTIDGLHPNDEGYRIIFEKMDEALSRL